MSGVAEPVLAPAPVPRESEVEWDLTHVVAELRRARATCLEGQALQQAQRARGPLPSRETLDGIVRALRSALFPSYFGSAELTASSVDYFVGHTLDGALRSLEQQARRTLSYECAAESDARVASPEMLDRKAARLIARFATLLPDIRTLLEGDVEAAYAGDPAARSRAEVVFCYPGVSAIFHHRLAHELHGLGLTLLARIISESAHSSTGIDIHPGATIGEHFFIDHGTGVVIGETAVIGRRVRLYQGVTLGAKRFPRDARGEVVKGLLRHPIIEDDVVIYAGATILGRITIGRGSTIGGNVWLTRGVPPHSQLTQQQLQSECFERGDGI